MEPVKDSLRRILTRSVLARAGLRSACGLRFVLDRFERGGGPNVT